MWGKLAHHRIDSESDWADPDLPNLVAAPDKLSGADDDSFKKAKEDEPNPAIDAGSIPPQKSDLLRFYVANEQMGGEDFLYLGWVRGDTSGSTNMDFKFNQNACDPALGPADPGCSSNEVTPMRSPRDILITFQLGGAATRFFWACPAGMIPPMAEPAKPVLLPVGGQSNRWRT